MNTKVWLMAAVLMGATLLISSCGRGPAATTPTAPAPVTPAPATPAPATPAPASTLTPAPTAPAEKPKYRGTITVVLPSSTSFFDTGTGSQGLATGIGGLVYEQFMRPDWTLGPAGNGKFDYGTGALGLDAYGPSLAASWETPAPGTWIFKIRKGVHWALNPASEASKLMAGREYTPDDAIFNFQRLVSTPVTNVNIAQPNLAKTSTLEKTADGSLVLKTPYDAMLGFQWFAFGGGSFMQYPPEAIKKYGSVSDWRNAVGTGPFMVTDFIGDSILELTRNPNYWDTDPVGSGKGNQLPYIDKVRFLVVPDPSTQQAALRTGKADWLTNIQQEDAAALMKTNPKLMEKGYPLSTPLTFAMRTDKANLPFADKRVRQALTMATDYQALKDFYRGQAEIPDWPVLSVYNSVYIPLEKLPDSVQTLFKYNPVKAKQLLTEAGYPNGFQTKVIVQNTSNAVDVASLIKAQWSKVNVDLEIQTRETAVYTSIVNAKSYDEMILNGMGATFTFWVPGQSWRGTARSNLSYINNPPGQDPVIEAAFQEMQKNVIVNMPKVYESFRGLVPYLLEQAFVIQTPSPYSHTLWQPWVKNYHGEVVGGGPPHIWLPYVWVDQDLKAQMTGAR